MARDEAYYEAEKIIESVNNHPQIFTTNSRMPAHIRIHLHRTAFGAVQVFVTPFVDGTVENKGGKHGT